MIDQNFFWFPIDAASMTKMFLKILSIVAQNHKNNYRRYEVILYLHFFISLSITLSSTKLKF